MVSTSLKEWPLPIFFREEMRIQLLLQNLVSFTIHAIVFVLVLFLQLVSSSQEHSKATTHAGNRDYNSHKVFDDLLLFPFDLLQILVSNTVCHDNSRVRNCCLRLHSMDFSSGPHWGSWCLLGYSLSECQTERNVDEGSKFFSTSMQFYRLVSLCFSCCINNEINFILLVFKFFIFFSLFVHLIKQYLYRGMPHSWGLWWWGKVL